MGHEGANDSAGKEALTCTGKIGIFYVTGSTGTKNPPYAEVPLRGDYCFLPTFCPQKNEKQ
jgi:hypothetical protein